MIDRRTIERLMSLPNVIAVGEGYKSVDGKATGTRAIVASVVEKIPSNQLINSALIPQSVKNVPTDVIETGVIKALAVDRTDYMRPVPGGVSCGHGDITAGTWGCLVTKDSKIYALSNNHIFANSNKAKIGDKIYQPGPFDIDGSVNDDYLIANLTEFVPIDFGDSPDPSPCPIAGGITNLLNAIARLFNRRTRIPPPIKEATPNLIDAAIARPVNLQEVLADILDIGKLTGLAEVGLGDTVIKSGRTTAVTKDTVTQTNVTVRVQYGEGQIATFEDQVMAGPMCEGGDSGSAVLDSKHRFVGLLFAGSDSVTIFSRAKNVMDGLKLKGVI